MKDQPEIRNVSQPENTQPTGSSGTCGHVRAGTPIYTCAEMCEGHCKFVGGQPDGLTCALTGVRVHVCVSGHVGEQARQPRHRGPEARAEASLERLDVQIYAEARKQARKQAHAQAWETRRARLADRKRVEAGVGI